MYFSRISNNRYQCSSSAGIIIATILKTPDGQWAAYKEPYNKKKSTPIAEADDLEGILDSIVNRSKLSSGNSNNKVKEFTFLRKMNNRKKNTYYMIRDRDFIACIEKGVETEPKSWRVMLGSEFDTDPDQIIARGISFEEAVDKAYKIKVKDEST